MPDSLMRVNRLRTLNDVHGHLTFPIGIDGVLGGPPRRPPPPPPPPRGGGVGGGGGIHHPHHPNRKTPIFSNAGPTNITGVGRGVGFEGEGGGGVRTPSMPIGNVSWPWTTFNVRRRYTHIKESGI